MAAAEGVVCSSMTKKSALGSKESMRVRFGRPEEDSGASPGLLDAMVDGVFALFGSSYAMCSVDFVTWI